jgi:hypothetical protein
VLPRQRHREEAEVPTAAEQPEARAVGPGLDVSRQPVGSGCQPERLDAAARLTQDFDECRALASRHQQPVPRDDVQQPREGGLDGGEVGIDVRVVELDVAHDRDRRQVVDELGPLVEEGRVVLVALDHERLARGEPIAAAEVERDSPDEKRRREAGPVEQEREQARGRGLAVRSRDDERPPRAQELLGHERGQAGVALAPVEHRLDLGVAAGKRVADHHEIGVLRHVRFRVRRAHLDPERLELGRHRRVDVLV